MSQSVTIRLDDETVQMLDERSERESSSRTKLIEFALQPVMEQRTVRPLLLPKPVVEMLELIAKGQGVERTDVMRRALIDYAQRASVRWQINARADQRPKLAAVAEAIASVNDHDPGIPNEWGRAPEA